jgi:hypothetical protein
MAYYDHGAAMEAKEDEAKYLELKNWLMSKNDKGEINEWFRARRHLIRMEAEIEKQDIQLKEYKQFFEMLQKLLPRVPSIYDTIG